MYGCNLPIEIYEIVKDNPKLANKLFNVSKNHDHPLEKVYRECGLDKIFELIDRVYGRRFNILTEINDYLDPSSAFDDLMTREEKGWGNLIEMFQKYNVQPNEFNYSYFNRYLTPFKDIAKGLQQREFIDPRIQWLTGGKNNIVTFVNNNDYVLHTLARYDYSTNQIYPPI